MSAGARNAAAANARAMAEFRKQLESLFGDFDESAKRIVSRQAAVGIAETVKNTPVGVYDKESRAFLAEKGTEALYRRNKKLLKAPDRTTRIGGTLKKAWTKTPTHKVGNTWVSGYANPTSYAVYVNEGHRIVKDGVTIGLVPGKHMLEIGMRAAEKALPSIAAAEIARIKRKSGF